MSGISIIYEITVKKYKYLFTKNSYISIMIILLSMHGFMQLITPTTVIL